MLLALGTEGRRRRRGYRGTAFGELPGVRLQLHQHATVILDDVAAARLRLADYYREVYAGKPAWQHL